MRTTVLIAFAAAGLSLPVLAGCSYHDHDYDDDDHHYRHREAYYDDCGPVHRAEVVRYREYDKPRYRDHGRHHDYRHHGHHR